jgi:hypothetical protein
MALLDKALITELGIELSDQDYELLAEHFDTTLRTRVIAEIVAELTPEQAQQLSQLQSAPDEQLLEWLGKNVVNFKDIVSEEVDILLGELAENSDAFNKNSSSPEL